MTFDDEQDTAGIELASTPVPLCSSLEERISEPELLRKVVREREQTPSRWWSTT